MDLSKFHLSTANTLLAFLVVIFITLAINIGYVNYTFQVASQQRDQFLELSNAIHQSEQITANKTDNLILNHVNQDHEIHARQAIILKNQEKILNSSVTTKQDLDMIRHASDQVDSIVARQKNNTAALFHMKQEIDRILNKTG